MLQDRFHSPSESTLTVIQEVQAPLIGGDAYVTTVLVSHPPGSPGNPPHRLPGGPGFGYMLTGEMLFELEDQAPRVLRAGEAFWGPGGDVIHYQDANNRADIPCSFVLTLFCRPEKPMLEWVSGEELGKRTPLRVPRSDSGTMPAFDDARVHQWREYTRAWVLAGAAAVAAVDPPQSPGSISVTVTGRALSNDVLLADTGRIALATLGDFTNKHSHSMSVIPMRLDMLSELPAIRVHAHDVAGPMRLSLAVELTAYNQHDGSTSVVTSRSDSVLLDAQMPSVALEFRLPQQYPGHPQSPG